MPCSCATLLRSTALEQRMMMGGDRLCALLTLFPPVQSCS